MGKKSLKRKIMDYLVITAAALLYGAALSLFLAPNMLAPGGVSGISIILNRVIPGIPTGTWIFLLNIPILALGTWKFGIKFILSTIYCTVLTSYFTNLLEPVGALTKDPLLAALAGSSLIALSLGSVFKAGSTTGGMDIIIKVIRLKLPHLKTGFLYLVEDIMIIGVSALVFQNIDRALYAGLCALVTSFLLDLVLYGRDGAKLIFIISNHSETIARRVLDELNVGVTFIQGSGAYSGKDKKVILCVMKKPLSPKVEEIVKKEDPMAFMIFSSATEIYGEGYKNIFSEKL
ncbi:MAG: YitT family protein [Bacteroidales bacterium]|nr:YitT family protein [Lachnoclostridium sp.]MCM1384100.1 YitT family protein [Lachnoclostridium sp.]MCM1465659.1 YitT family protein [Bacteroidales bacterium]